MIEFMHIKFDESTNIEAEKYHFILDDETKNINTINDSQIIIIEDI
jgi:hypothetical protein